MKRLGRVRVPGRGAADGPGATAPTTSLTVDSRYDQLPRVPDCPPGWTTGPPDFVILGAQKAGTTWWQGIVEDHPGVLRPPGQRMELHFFDHFWDRWPTPAQLELYRGYFPRPPSTIVGEKTPGYLYQPWVAPMLAAAAPDARLIVLVRDPVKRYASGLGLLVRSGAIKGEIGAGEIGMREHRIAEAMERGRYAQQVEWFMRHFPRERMLLLQYERCAADAQGEATRTYEFLGLEPHTVTQAEIDRSRKRSSERPPVTSEIAGMLADWYAPDVRRLQALMPDLDVTLWPEIAGALARQADESSSRTTTVG
jgi:Sulfotransferase domain